MLCLDVWCPWDISLRAPLPGFIYATGLGFTSVLVKYGLEPSFFVSKSIFESFCRSTSLMGRTRYTNPRVPKGHIHVSSPRDSIRVADSGWVSKHQSSFIFDFFNLRLSSIIDFFNLRLLQSSVSSNFDFIYLRLLEIFNFFDFFKLRLYIFSTSNAMAKIVGFLNPLSRWE
jgi:hypothetical protein